MWYFTPFPITSIYSPPRNVLFLEVLRPSKISDLSYTYPVLQILVFLFIPQNMHLLKRCFYGSFYSFSTPSLAAHHCWISKSTQASAYCGKAAASARGVREPLMRVRPPLFSRTASAEIPFSQPLNYILLHSLSWSLILWFPKHPLPNALVVRVFSFPLIPYSRGFHDGFCSQALCMLSFSPCSTIASQAIG